MIKSAVEESNKKVQWKANIKEKSTNSIIKQPNDQVIDGWMNEWMVLQQNFTLYISNHWPSIAVIQVSTK